MRGLWGSRSRSSMSINYFGGILCGISAGICFGLLGRIIGRSDVAVLAYSGGLLTGAIGGSLFGLLIARHRLLQDRGQR